MTAKVVFLCKNSYTKDGNRRCYATFAQSSGELMQFNGSALPDSSYPSAFAVCDVSFDIAQFGRNTSFILTSLDVIGQLVDKE